MTTQATSQSPARVSEKTEVDAIYHKINWRIVPIILFAYILAFLDRINVGFTQLQMKQDLSFSDGVFGLGAGLFFITYLMFEVPSNLLLEKIGARYTFLRIMVLWGLRLVRGAPVCLRCAGHFRNHPFVRSVARTALACCPAYDRRHTLLVCDDLFPITC
jgi:hypothetical protein